MKRLSYEEKLKLKCKHFNGIGNESCKVGVVYKELCHVSDFPCHYKESNVICSKRENYTEEEVSKIVDESNRIAELISKGLSPCCEAKIDDSHVIKEGSHKGHGARFCSKCGKLAYMV